MASTFLNLRLNLWFYIFDLRRVVSHCFLIVQDFTFWVFLFWHSLCVSDCLRCLHTYQSLQNLCLVLEPRNEPGIKVIVPIIKQVLHVGVKILIGVMQEVVWPLLLDLLRRALFIHRDGKFCFWPKVFRWHIAAQTICRTLRLLEKDLLNQWWSLNCSIPMNWLSSDLSLYNWGILWFFDDKLR